MNEELTNVSQMKLAVVYLQNSVNASIRNPKYVS